MQLYWFVLLVGLLANYGVATTPNEDPSCFDERDCSTLRAWMSNPDDLARYCAEFKDDPAVKLCKRTCQVCKAPAGENQECKDESSECYTIQQAYPKIKDQKDKQKFCEQLKSSSFVQKCKGTCRLCPPYLLSFPTPLPSECKDESKECEQMKNQWYRNNPEGFAHYCRDNKQKCKKTCNLCENPTKPPHETKNPTTPPQATECKDEWKYCEQEKDWYRNNPQGFARYCENNKQRCKKTCNFCGENPTTPSHETKGPVCEDEDAVTCDNIIRAYNGVEQKILRFCERFMNRDSNSVQKKCRRTCQLCGDGKPVDYQKALHPGIQDPHPECKDGAENCYDIAFMHKGVEKDILAYCDRYRENPTVKTCKKTCRKCQNHEP